MEEVKPHMVKQTITFSDGTETVINYNQNGEAPTIEHDSAEMVEANKEPEVVEVEVVKEEEFVPPVEE